MYYLYSIANFFRIRTKKAPIFSCILLKFIYLFRLFNDFTIFFGDKTTVI